MLVRLILSKSLDEQDKNYTSYMYTDPHPRKTQTHLTIGKLEKKIDSKRIQM